LSCAKRQRRCSAVDVAAVSLAAAVNKQTQTLKKNHTRQQFREKIATKDGDTKRTRLTALTITPPHPPTVGKTTTTTPKDNFLRH